MEIVVLLIGCRYNDEDDDFDEEDDDARKELEFYKEILSEDRLHVRALIASSDPMDVSTT